MIKLSKRLSNGDGSYSERTREAKLEGITGGLNIVQTDYDNDGFADLIVVGLAGGQLGVVEKGASGLTLEPVDCADLTRRANHVRFENTPCELLPSGAAASSAASGSCSIAR